MSLRDQILQADDIRREYVVIPEWGDAKIEVRNLTAAEQLDLIRRCRDGNGKFNGEAASWEAVLACCYDPESGERLFDPADRDALKRKSASAFGKLLAAANRAAGFRDEDEVTRDLDETPADASSSG